MIMDRIKGRPDDEAAPASQFSHRYFTSTIRFVSL